MTLLICIHTFIIELCNCFLFVSFLLLVIVQKESNKMGLSWTFTPKQIPVLGINIIGLGGMTIMSNTELYITNIGHVPLQITHHIKGNQIIIPQN